jgi:hypothetical protein
MRREGIDHAYVLLVGIHKSIRQFRVRKWRMSEAMKATPRVKSIQRAALAMLVVAGVINYVDRATLERYPTGVNRLGIPESVEF